MKLKLLLVVLWVARKMDLYESTLGRRLCLWRRFTLYRTTITHTIVVSSQWLQDKFVTFILIHFGGKDDINLTSKCLCWGMKSWPSQVGKFTRCLMALSKWFTPSIIRSISAGSTAWSHVRKLVILESILDFYISTRRLSCYFITIDVDDADDGGGRWSSPRSRPSFKNDCFLRSRLLLIINVNECLLLHNCTDTIIARSLAT